MKLKTLNRKLTALFLCGYLSAGSASAQDSAEQSKAAATAQANNPLANMTAFNLHNYYIGEMTDTNEDADQFWFRFAKPFSIADSQWLFRASLPINSFPTPPDNDTVTGIGDLNIFAAYLFNTGNPAISFGIGPQLTMPTASKDEVGSEKWSAGLANVLFDGRSAKFQYGYLLTWQHSFAGNDDRDTVNVGAFQPFYFYQLGKGLYTGGAPIWVKNFDNGNYSIPLGIRLGKVFKRGNTVFNTFAEYQFSVADKGPGQPEQQLFLGFNMQFLK